MFELNQQQHGIALIPAKLTYSNSNNNSYRKKKQQEKIETNGGSGRTNKKSIENLKWFLR